MRFGEKPVPAFNWEIEFPEVFDRDNPGFDAIVGNPPFAGKNTTINAHISGYQDWLKVVNPESHGNADLVAHFFRRAFSLLRESGCFGLIATNTIAQVLSIKTLKLAAEVSYGLMRAVQVMTLLIFSCAVKHALLVVSYQTQQYPMARS
ncbi:Eco57I restriction-modification methylase domain-containing protein [Nostoc sp. NMS7]|uniref:Eco57I restriction-modification methylase domain-containing protein n=1 Tax=Nostoc sp. NMS7 TaxID=2815391 RepID=UPI0025D5BA7A|nr:DNA methyltransferase [Nostoc sp. NMS7]